MTLFLKSRPLMSKWVVGGGGMKRLPTRGWGGGGEVLGSVGGVMVDVHPDRSILAKHHDSC